MKRTMMAAWLMAASMLAMAQGATGGVAKRCPPLTPAWAFGHIVWEDSINTTTGAERIVNGYIERGIPVDAVIIDSPWSTSYNDFTWDDQRYADPVAMMKGFAASGVRTILWLTGCVNTQCKDTRQQKAATYDEVVAHNYGVDNSKPYKWWKGTGQHIDFTNAEATQWWYGQLDKVFNEYVYGWKVDQGEQHLPADFDTSIGHMTNEEFRHYYYDAMYDYTVGRKREGIIIARPYSHQGGLEASVEKMNMGWCGDFGGDWDGLRLQIDNIYRSCQYGYGAVGCEVGGFFGARSKAVQLARYAQFGCTTACIINGGENGPFSAHLPWWHSQEVEQVYRWCVDWMKRLVPYKFSAVVDAHLQGGSLLQNTNLQELSHQIGADIFVKAIDNNDGHAVFHLPSSGQWIDYWTGESHQGGSLIEGTWPLQQFPLYVRAGAIIPQRDAAKPGKTVFNIYPSKQMEERIFHLPTADGIDYYNCRVSYDPQQQRVTLDADRSVEAVFVVGQKQVAAKGSRISKRIKQ